MNEIKRSGSPSRVMLTDDLKEEQFVAMNEKTFGICALVLSNMDFHKRSLTETYVI